MSKFILINENINFNSIEKWYRSQSQKLDNTFANVIPLNIFLIRNTYLEKVALLEINDADLKFFTGLSYKVYNDKDLIPIIIPVSVIWDELTLIEKDQFLSIDDTQLKRFRFDLQIRTFFNINNQDFIDALTYLETINMIFAG